ncbi:MAG: L,D-transpeptidase family protein [Chitinophagales bacterium]|nr:L,D-transpeptidase family protein [Chitinophagales bacterium]
MKTLFSVLVVVILIACKPRDEKTALKMFEQIDYPETSLQKLVVDIYALNSTRGMMRVYERTDTGRSWGNPVMKFEVVIGKNGLAFDSTQFKKLEYGHYKHEGDGCSPAGLFTLGKIFSYHDTTGLKMPFEQVDVNDLCVDDINSQYYNLLIDDDTIINKDYTSFERMERKDMQYEYGVWVNYNTSPQVPGMGSCIFLHIWKDPSHATSGCTAMSKENMLKLINWLDEKKNPILMQYINPKF